MDMREEHSRRQDSDIQTDPDQPASTDQSEVPTPRQQLLSRALEKLPDVYAAGQKLLSDFENLSDNKKEITPSYAIISRANQLHTNLFTVNKKLNGFIFSLDNAHSVLAYVEPGASEAQFVVGQVVRGSPEDAKRQEVDTISMDYGGLTEG